MKQYILPFVAVVSTHIACAGDDSSISHPSDGVPDAGVVDRHDAGFDPGRASCGNGVLDPGEVCDPLLDTPTCATAGMRDGLAPCLSDCDGYDISFCDLAPAARRADFVWPSILCLEPDNISRVDFSVTAPTDFELAKLVFVSDTYVAELDGPAAEASVELVPGTYDVFVDGSVGERSLAFPGLIARDLVVEAHGELELEIPEPQDLVLGRAPTIGETIYVFVEGQRFPLPLGEANVLTVSPDGVKVFGHLEEEGPVGHLGALEDGVLGESKAAFMTLNLTVDEDVERVFVEVRPVEGGGEPESEERRRYEIASGELNFAVFDGSYVVRMCHVDPLEGGAAESCVSGVVTPGVHDVDLRLELLDVNGRITGLGESDAVVFSGGREAFALSVSQLTDDGSFSLKLPEGEYTVGVEGPRGRFHVGQVSLPSEGMLEYEDPTPSLMRMELVTDLDDPRVHFGLGPFHAPVRDDEVWLNPGATRYTLSSGLLLKEIPGPAAVPPGARVGVFTESFEVGPSDFDVEVIYDDWVGATIASARRGEVLDTALLPGTYRLRVEGDDFATSTILPHGRDTRVDLQESLVSVALKLETFEQPFDDPRLSFSASDGVAEGSWALPRDAIRTWKKNGSFRLLGTTRWGDVSVALRECF